MDDINLAKALAQRHQNITMQKLYLGLDFENAPLEMPLAEGNYIAAQVPQEAAIDW